MYESKLKPEFINISSTIHKIHCEVSVKFYNNPESIRNILQYPHNSAMIEFPRDNEYYILR